MPALVSWMPMPSYAYKTLEKGEKQVLIGPGVRGRYWEPVSAKYKMASVNISRHPVKM
jgi:hypothetical protein